MRKTDNFLAIRRTATRSVIGTKENNCVNSRLGPIAFVASEGGRCQPSGLLVKHLATLAGLACLAVPLSAFSADAAAGLAPREMRNTAAQWKCSCQCMHIATGFMPLRQPACSAPRRATGSGSAFRFPRTSRTLAPFVSQPSESPWIYFNATREAAWAYSSTAGKTFGLYRCDLRGEKWETVPAKFDFSFVRVQPDGVLYGVTKLPTEIAGKTRAGRSTAIAC